MEFSLKRDNRLSMVIVGGPPRSGTTLMNALLTSSRKSNHMVPECHYFTSLVEAYYKSYYTFKSHTAAYFSDVEEYSRYHGDLMTHVLRDVSDYLGSPEYLVLKDPYLTPFFEIILQLIPSTRFVYMLRDPRDTVASTFEVFRRRNEDVTEEKVSEICKQINDYYFSVVGKIDVFGQALAVVRYEHLVVEPEQELQQIRAFGLTDIDPKFAWAGSRKFSDEEKMTVPFFTPLWGANISDSSIGNYQRNLSPEHVCLVEQLCAGILAKHYGDKPNTKSN